MADDEDEIVLNTFRIYYRFLSVDEVEVDGTDMTTDSFAMYLSFARDELSRQLSSRGIPGDALTENEENIALCHLIADNFEMGISDWNFRSQSQAPGVSFSRGEDTGPREALNKLLDSIELDIKRTSASGGRGKSIPMVQLKDAKNYPKRFKRTDIPSWDTSENGFDSNEVSDFGQSIYDPGNNSW